MRKTIVYILILGILGFGVWFFLFRDNSTFGEEEAGFKITDTASIGSIFLASQKGDTISLKKTNDGWILNNRYPASVRMTQTLLETFQQQQAAYPVPENAHNTVIKSLAGQGIKVEVMDRKGKVMKVFYVGGQAGAKKGTYMLMEGAQRPYVIELPSYEGYITPRYSTDISEWRNRTVVDIPAAQLATVSVQYASPDEYLNSFTMVKKPDGKFDIQLHPDLKMTAPLNERRVKTYAGFFQKVGCEGFLEGVTGLDSIIASVPKLCDIKILDDKGRGNDIAVYKMRVNKRSKNVTEEEIPEFDADRLYGIINNGKDTVILQTNTFGKMFRKGYEFYEADVAQQ
jgi:hypothetical protein